jgi:NAD(P)-dependent dehydrogenase (short-subunit alcohol dehydrogenase family)
MTERVVIVGGTSGIGLASAQRLVDGGFEVIITGRDGGKLRAALDQLGKNADGFTVDARDREATRSFFAGLGQVDHAVITATGVRAFGPISDLDLAELRQAAEDKLLAHASTAQAALEVLRKDGSLTFVTAASAGAAMPGTAGLAAINAAVQAMVPVLAIERKPLRVNAVSPGVIDTPWWNWMPEDSRKETFDAFAGGIPVGRIGRPEDVAAAIAFLIGNSYTNGIVLTVDGGARLSSAA